MKGIWCSTILCCFCGGGGIVGRKKRFVEINKVGTAGNGRETVC
jgi:hypothetical protein